MNTHAQLMSLALQLAEKGRLTVSPNPMVGCVIVNDDQIVGQGYHQQAGKPHAEIIALREAKEKAINATAYVTLEPCCHFGRTPPCVNALISAGIKKVFIACLDPNPLIAGQGIAALQAAGIEVYAGIAGSQAKQLNEVFFHYITQQRPFVIAKWAMSLDGKTITAEDDDRQITSLEAQIHTHQLRQQMDAILIGACTAVHDNPQLTVRLPASTKQPTRIILAGKQYLPPHLKVFNKELGGKTIVAAPNKDSIKDLPSHVEIISLPNNEGLVDLPMLLNELAKREICSLLIEGGMKIHESFFKEKLVNKIQVYVAPVIISTLDQKRPINITQYLPIGIDHHFIGNLGD